MSTRFESSAPEQESAPSPVEWEEGRCPLCDGDHWSPRLEAPDGTEPGRWFLVVQCQDCGLSFTNPRPSPRCLRRLYAPRTPALRPTKPRRWWRLGGGRDLVRQWLPLRGDGRLLDVGVGAPDALSRLAARGWQVTVLHASAVAGERLRLERGWRPLVGTLPHPALAPGSFDAVTLLYTLGQADRPLEVLRAAHALLAPAGQLAVAAPNLDSLPAHWFGPAWRGLDLPRQLSHFTPWTLRLLLHRVGFRVQELRTVRRSGWARASARAAAALPDQAPTLAHLLQSRPVASVASWLGQLARRGDCVFALATRA